MTVGFLAKVGVGENMQYFSGRIWTDNPYHGYLGVEGGVLREIGIGDPPERPVAEGDIAISVIDCHTHIGDAGLILDRRYSLEELVAPPSGLKHRYLRETADERIVSDMRRYSEELCRTVDRFIDFREGGVHGVSLIREATDKAIVFGRPVSDVYDPNEVDDLLEVSDGIGIPSITDMGPTYVAALADHVHRSGKLLGIHASERVREDMDAVLSLEPDFIVHMTVANDSDFGKCSDADVPVVVCPTSNLYFGNVPPISRMVDSCVTLAIGTDNAMLCPPDMIREASVFNSIVRAQGGHPDVTRRALFLGGSKCLITRSNLGLNIGQILTPKVFEFDIFGQ